MKMVNAVDTEMLRELAELQLELKKRQLFSALRWRQRVETCLTGSGIGFDEWLLLDAIWSRLERTGDAVSEVEVARDLELDALTVWHSMAVLYHRGLVSRGCSMSGKAWRVFVTGKGADLLRVLEPALERASAASP